ncbi:MAG: DegT/DnrJ/EryC1/StrS family aminotransferase, partial [archaeon]|nr:DegT/DnrJ/EryC1/StrS family aminotransferase [archaeon]
MTEVKPISQMEPWFDEKEREAIDQYMKDGGWLTEFKKTKEFEDRIAGYTGASYCSVVSNGTVSLFT